MRRQFMTFGLLAVVVSCLISACDRESDVVAQREGDSNYTEDFDEDLMDAAIAEARSNLGAFESALKARRAGDEAFSIKKGFSYGSDDEEEFIWISDVRQVGTGFEGKISNEPVNDIGVEMGQAVGVSREEVADWMYMSDGSLRAVTQAWR